MQLEPGLVAAVWELTKPKDKLRALGYKKALSFVISVPDRMAHYHPFYVPKDEGRRLIFAAQRELQIVQGVLASWIVRSFPLGDDYCYLGGGGVLAAVQEHLQSSFGFVFDLKNAFESVRSRMISRRLKLYLPGRDEKVVDLIVDLLTVGGKARQGCISTPYVYNLVIKPLDDQLRLLLKQFRLAAYTRYSDNICFSSCQPIDFEELEGQVARFVRGNGFAISWSQRFEDEPVVYLGTQIYRGRLTLAEEKYGEFCYRLLEALGSPTLEIYRAQITGIFNWAHHICGENIPEDLLDLLARYFGKVGKTPASLGEILARRGTWELPAR